MLEWLFSAKIICWSWLIVAVCIKSTRSMTWVYDSFWCTRSLFWVRRPCYGIKLYLWPQKINNLSLNLAHRCCICNWTLLAKVQLVSTRAPDVIMLIKCSLWISKPEHMHTMAHDTSSTQWADIHVCLPELFYENVCMLIWCSCICLWLISIFIIPSCMACMYEHFRVVCLLCFILSRASNRQKSVSFGSIHKRPLLLLVHGKTDGLKLWFFSFR